MPEIAVAHNIPYVATATHGYPFDLMAKVAKAVATPGPSYVHVLAVCPNGWGSANDMINRHSRLAVQTGVFPLYEVRDGVVSITVDPPRKPVEEYLQLQKRFAHFTEDDIARAQAEVQKNRRRLERLMSS